MSPAERLERWASNVRLLFVDSDLWPDDDEHQRTPWRKAAYAASRWALGLLVPLAFLGMVSCALRPRLVPLVCTAHVLTMLLVAAFFYAEQRYRVPYDVFLMLLALEGARGTATASRTVLARVPWRRLRS